MCALVVAADRQIYAAAAAAAAASLIGEFALSVDGQARRRGGAVRARYVRERRRRAYDAQKRTRYR